MAFDNLSRHSMETKAASFACLTPLEMTHHLAPRCSGPIPLGWHLDATCTRDSSISIHADISATEAWGITRGSGEVVVAVIDDGFDLGHPVFARTVVDPARKDFRGHDQDPGAEPDDDHGTPAAALAIGATGVAPGCAFLPLRVGFEQEQSNLQEASFLDPFRHASEHADVLICSFSTLPSSDERVNATILAEIQKLTETGGKRKKGLVIVIAAGNSNAPTQSGRDGNRNGVWYRRDDRVKFIPSYSVVRAGIPSLPGVIAVSAVTSLLRKAAYSEWGPDIAVTAPSGNGHPLGNPNTLFPDDAAQYRRFTPNDGRYDGAGLVTAVNRPGHACSERHITEDPTTRLSENFYTEHFSGTSGAAPIVGGVAALMLSANPHLTAREVKRIVMATADHTHLDLMLDNPGDPNLRGVSGAFDGEDGRSAFFGAGKVNAYRAVRRAQALAGIPADTAAARAGGS